MLQEYVRFKNEFSIENSSIYAISHLFRAFSHLWLTPFLLKFHSARLQTITYLPTESQAGSFNTLDFYKETDGPTNRRTDQPTDGQTNPVIEMRGRI